MHLPAPPASSVAQTSTTPEPAAQSCLAARADLKVTAALEKATYRNSHLGFAEGAEVGSSSSA